VLLNDVVTENKKLQAEAKVTGRKLCDMNEMNNYLENRVNSLENTTAAGVCAVAHS
jgi:hypothetical protein